MITALKQKTIQRGDICILALNEEVGNSSSTTLTKSRPSLAITDNHFGVTVIPFTTSKKYNIGIGINCEQDKPDRISYIRYDQVATVKTSRLKKVGVNLALQYPNVYNEIIDTLGKIYRGEINFEDEIAKNAIELEKNGNLELKEKEPPIDHELLVFESEKEEIIPVKKVKEKKKLQPSLSDVINNFINITFDIRPNSNVSADDVYILYTEYCTNNSLVPINQKAFSMVMINNGYKKSNFKSKVVYNGIKIKEMKELTYIDYIRINNNEVKEGSAKLYPLMVDAESRLGYEKVYEILKDNKIEDAARLLGIGKTYVYHMRSRYGLTRKHK